MIRKCVSLFGLYETVNYTIFDQSFFVLVCFFCVPSSTPAFRQEIEKFGNIVICVIFFFCSMNKFSIVCRRWMHLILTSRRIDKYWYFIYIYFSWRSDQKFRSFRRSLCCSIVSLGLLSNHIECRAAELVDRLSVSLHRSYRYGFFLLPRYFLKFSFREKLSRLACASRVCRCVYMRERVELTVFSCVFLVSTFAFVFRVNCQQSFIFCWMHFLLLFYSFDYVYVCMNVA